MQKNRSAIEVTMNLINPTSTFFEWILRLYSAREGVTEQFKADDQMEWVRRMDSILNMLYGSQNAEFISQQIGLKAADYRIILHIHGEEVIHAISLWSNAPQHARKLDQQRNRYNAKDR